MNNRTHKPSFNKTKRTGAGTSLVSLSVRNLGDFGQLDSHSSTIVSLVYHSFRNDGVQSANYNKIKIL